MNRLEADGVVIFPSREDIQDRLMAVEFSELQLQAAELYHYRGEFCPVKKREVVYSDWYPTDKQIVNAGVPILDVIKTAKAEGRRESKAIYYEQGKADMRAEYENNEAHIRLIMDAFPACEIGRRMTELESREQSVELAAEQLNAKADDLRKRERKVERKEAFYREYKEQELKERSAK